MVGNVTVHRLPALPSLPWLLSLAIAAAALLMLPRLRLPGVALAYFCLTACAAQDRLAARLPTSSGQVDVELSGWVDEFPRHEPLRTVFTFRVAAPSGADDTPTSPRGDTADATFPRRVRLTWYEPPFAIEPGASLVLRVRLRPPRGLVNPAGFDYERWLLTEDIGATGYVRSGVPDESAFHGPAQAWLGYRARLANAISARVVEPSAAALLGALGLGVRADFTDEQWAVLRRTGTSHLVAISGLHIGLVAVFAFQLLLRLQLMLGGRPARHAWSLAAVLALVPAAAYAGLAGFELPTFRALTMLGVAQLVVLSRRRVVPLVGLSLAALVVLVWDPLATLGASFWLSFGAVAAIIAGLPRAGSGGAGAVPPSRSGRGRLASGLAALCRLQVVIGVVLLPLSALHFAEVSIAAFAVNLVAVPLFSFVLVPAALLLVGATATGADVAAAMIAPVAAALTEPVWSGLAAAAAWPLAAVSVPAPSGPALTLALVGGAVFAIARSRLRWLGLAGLGALMIRPTERPGHGAVDLTVLDVGHGLAVIVRTAAHTLVFDAGPLSRTGFDAGREIVVPALRTLSPARLDRIMVSHGDSDHAGGLPALRAAFPTAALAAGPDVQASGATICATGQEWVWDDVSFRVLHPNPGSLPLGNDSSCVLLIEAAGGSALLTGDVETRAEGEIVANGIPPVDLVVAPHHGSATSSTEPFVRATQPAHVIVSAGHRNRWNFPRADVVARWLAVGATVSTTGDAGALRVHISDTGTQVHGMRETQRRYWAADSGAAGASGL